MQYAAFLSLAMTVTLGASGLAQQPTNSDQLLIAVQRICPVSGQPLGGHGQPVRAKIGEQIAWLCCNACIKGKVDADHWSTVQANFAKSQQKCPVMGKPLPKDASRTVVDGRIVYVCCPPCADKIAADREKYLRAVDDLYAASLKAERTRDAEPAGGQHHH